MSECQIACYCLLATQFETSAYSAFKILWVLFLCLVETRKAVIPRVYFFKIKILSGKQNMSMAESLKSECQTVK